MPARRGLKWLGWAFLVAILLVFLGGPFVVMLSTALKSLKDVTMWPPRLWPAALHLENFLRIWTEINLLRFFGNSLVVAGGSTVVALVVALPAAYAIARFQFALRKTIYYAILVTQMIAPVVFIIALFKLMRNLHLLDSHLGLILIDAAFVVPVSVWLLVGFLESIPVEVEQAAMLDGASHLATLLQIVTPLAKPGLVATALFAFITGWNEYVLALTFLTTPEKATFTIGVTAFLGKNVVLWHYLMAAALVSVVPVFLVYLGIDKYLAKGLTAGAIK